MVIKSFEEKIYLNSGKQIAPSDGQDAWQGKDWDNFGLVCVQRWEIAE